MGLADDFERRLEQIVEGFFSKAFRSKLEPAEIGRRLLREMEGGKTVSVQAVYVPNSYTVRLASSDHSRFEGLIPELQNSFRNLLKEAAVERKWKLPGRLALRFDEDSQLKEGKFAVDAVHDASAEPPPTAAPRLRLVGDSKEWVLEGDRLVLGRQEDCDIVIPDPAASRRHAEISRRDDGWWITDLESSNDTFVNGAMVKQRRLHALDRIKIGSTELVYLDPEGSET